MSMEGTANLDKMMFMTQENDEDGDDLFTKLATAVTARKCKLVQKKAKLKQVVNTIQQTKRELVTWKDKVAAMKNEQRDIVQKQKLYIMNIQDLQESRAAQESVIADLDSKISELKLQVQEKREKYQAMIDDFRDTWEIYKKQYEEFPLAKKRQALKIELRLVEIEIKKTQLDISDIKYMSKVKREIAEKRRNAMCIKLAKTYVDGRKKIADSLAMQNKIRQMKQEISDIKAGKCLTRKLNVTDYSPASISLNSSQTDSIPNYTQNKLPPLKTSFWEMPKIQKPQSPPLRESFPNVTPSVSGFDWTTLLQSSSLQSFTSTLSRKRLSETGAKMKANQGKQTGQEMVVSTSRPDNGKAATAEEKKTNTLNKKVTLAVDAVMADKQESELPKNTLSTPCERGIQAQKQEKNKLENENNYGIGNENASKKQKKLKLDFSSLLTGRKFGNDRTYNNPNEPKEVGGNEKNQRQDSIVSTINTNMPVATERELVSSNTAKSQLADLSLSGIKNYIESLAKKNPTQHNLPLQREVMAAKNKLSAQTGAGSQAVAAQVMDSAKRQLENAGKTPLEAAVDNWAHATESQNDVDDTYLLSLNPSPQPDLVPVPSVNNFINSNNQASQAQQPETKSMSQDSEMLEYYSPVELDAAGRLYYQRLEAESPPPMVYPTMQQMEVAGGGQSKYFSNKTNSIPHNQHPLHEDQYLSMNSNQSYSDAEQLEGEEGMGVAGAYRPYSPPVDYMGAMMSSPSDLRGFTGGMSPPDGRFPPAEDYNLSVKQPPKAVSFSFGKEPENNVSKQDVFGGSMFGNRAPTKSANPLHKLF